MFKLCVYISPGTRAVPYFAPGYPAVTSGGVARHSVNVSLLFTTAPAEGITVHCDAYLQSGATRTYPRPFEVYDEGVYLPTSAFAASVVGRHVGCACHISLLARDV